MVLDYNIIWGFFCSFRKKVSLCSAILQFLVVYYIEWSPQPTFYRAGSDKSHGSDIAILVVDSRDLEG